MIKCLLKRVFQMNKMKIIITCCTLASLLFSVYLYKHFYASIEDQQSFYLSEKISYKEVELLIMENDFSSVVFWKNNVDSVITNPKLNYEISTQRIEVMGNLSSFVKSNTIFDFSNGQYCILSNDVAVKLFGQSKVEGLMVEIEGEPFVIRSVVEGFNDTVIVHAKDPALMFDYVTFQGKEIYKNGKNSKKLNNKGNEVEEISNSFLMSILNILLIILFLCIMFTFSNIVLKNILAKINNTWSRIIIKVLVYIFSISILLLIFHDQLFIPEEWIPSKWSNNEFWKVFGEEQINRLELFYKIPIPNILLFRYIKFFNVFLSMILSILLIAIFWIILLNERLKMNKNDKIIDF
ncbi:hypothetical protein CKN81_06605 [Carnobacterium divergens]|nr:hypothetical protein CKN81_06605 [Carnobacterium divergens]